MLRILTDGTEADRRKLLGTVEACAARIRVQNSSSLTGSKYRLVQLSRKQSEVANTAVGRTWPNVASFAAVATRKQLRQLRDCVPLRWMQAELGREIGMFTLVAYHEPSDAELRALGVSRDAAERRMHTLLRAELRLQK